MNQYLLTFLLFIAAMLGAYELALLLTRWARWVAMCRGIVNPVTERSSHSVPTPRLGGLGLGLAYGLVCAAFLAALWFMPHEGAWIAFVPSRVGWIALGWTIMVATGLIDDIHDLHPAPKLALMALAALTPVLGADLVIHLPLIGPLPTHLKWALEAAIAVLWVLYLTNGFNFMDGMDGLAAGFALYAMMTMFAIVLGQGLYHQSLLQVRGEAYLLPVVAMACWGFLRWNRPPARVFMGDGGSLGLGYLLAVYVLMGDQPGVLGLSMPLVSGLTVLMPFLFDVTLTLGRRALHGRKLWQAHREHLYQRLLQAGFTHRQVLAINVRRFVICGVAALVGGIKTDIWAWAGLAVALAVMIDYWQRVVGLERRLAGQRKG